MTITRRAALFLWLPQDVDLVVLEFTLNEHPDEPFTDPQRQGYEQLVRKLLQLPGR